MKALKIAGFSILGVGFVAFAIWLVMNLWNWLIPELFNGR
jgi:preprotein translocase subunit Sss1